MEALDTFLDWRANMVSPVPLLAARSYTAHTHTPHKHESKNVSPVRGAREWRSTRTGIGAISCECQDVCFGVAHRKKGPSSRAK
jgi:hypothetical protein